VSVCAGSAVQPCSSAVLRAERAGRRGGGRLCVGYEWAILRGCGGMPASTGDSVEIIEWRKFGLEGSQAH